jgi:hypothetical protein
MARKHDSFWHVEPIAKNVAADLVVERHYLHRAPTISFAFGLYGLGDLVGVVTFGVPASRSVQKGACPSDPNLVLELNRLWVDDIAPKNSESLFVSWALGMLPARIVVSYADTAAGHLGYIYRALNFRYAGWTDMERKTPRFDYIVPGKHSREAFRGGVAQYTSKVRREPKVKYWIPTGDARDRGRLTKLCGWADMSWKEHSPPDPFGGIA